jgi:hypothetical protein
MHKPAFEFSHQWKLKSYFWIGMAFVLFLQVGCTTPLSEKWPPSQEVPLQNIYVSLDTWHAVIGFPKKHGRLALEHRSTPGDVTSRADLSYFEEWGFAERAWYLENQQGLSGVLRAMFWPTEGVVEIGKYTKLWATRTPQPPSDLFFFRVSEQGLHRVRQYLANTILTEEPILVMGKSRFFLAKDSYHLFHNCHFYIVKALQEAGLPLSSSFVITRSGLVWELEQIVEQTSDETMAMKLQ